jgi:hypothetical protein
MSPRSTVGSPGAEPRPVPCAEGYGGRTLIAPSGRLDRDDARPSLVVAIVPLSATVMAYLQQLGWL